MNKKNIAIIGAGISGLVLANNLKKIANVKIFEKARGVAGRMASRHNEQFSFDFGAQFFTVKNPKFHEFLQPFIEQKIVENWQANFVEIDGNKIAFQRPWDENNQHFVASPKMNSLAKSLAQGLTQDVDIVLQTKISKISKDQNILQIFDDKENFLGNFDYVLLAIPVHQALELIPDNFKFINDLKTKEMIGCFAVMLGLKNKPDIAWDCAYVKNSKLSWIAFENSKPNRNLACSLTILSRNLWAKNNLERDLNEVKIELIEEFELVTNSKIGDILHSDIHKWRYANIGKQNSLSSYFDQQNQIGLCGDWCVQGRVESAFLSALSLFNQIKGLL